MKKKLLAMLLVGAMALGLVACGSASGGSEGGQASGNSGATGTTASSGNGIRLVNGKIEVDAQLKKLAAMYEEETGVHVEIESLGGGIDIQGTLKGYYQSENMPDIFVNGGDTDFANWTGLLEDMSGEAWAADTDAAYKDESGAVLGFPYTTEAIGLAYNKDILTKAGIDPATLTSPDATRAAFETLNAKKDELGLTAVVGFYAEPTNLYWSTGNHVFGNYIDSGLDRDDSTYIDLLNDGGQLDEARFNAFAQYVEMLVKYSDPATVVSGDYNSQVLNFASGKYAFVTQGSWIGATMTGDDKDAYAAAGNFECGMAPYAFLDGIDTILTNSPSWWAVYKDGNVTEAKKFLQWLTTDKAQEVLVMEAGFVSPFKSSNFVANDPFAQTISDYTAAGKTSAWHWLGMKEGYAQNYTGRVYADFASGKIGSVEDFVETYKKVTASCYAQ